MNKDPKLHFYFSTLFLIGSIMMLKKVLAKYGGQVDFGEGGGGGWAQLILPLRLLLFYKVDNCDHHHEGGVKMMMV